VHREGKFIRKGQRAYQKVQFECGFGERKRGRELMNWSLQKSRETVNSQDKPIHNVAARLMKKIMLQGEGAYTLSRTLVVERAKRGESGGGGGRPIASGKNL